MTRFLRLALLVPPLIALSLPAQAKPEKYAIDPEHFSIAMSVRHIGYFDLIGLFTEGAGSFTFDEVKPAVSDIKVTIKTESFFSGHAKRDAHVRSADFLNAKENVRVNYKNMGDKVQRSAEYSAQPLSNDSIWYINSLLDNSRT